MQVTYKRQPGIAKKRKGNDLLLVSPNTMEAYCPNVTGAALWRLLAKPLSLQNAVRFFQDAFPNEDKRRIETDVTSQMITMVKLGFVSQTNWPRIVSSDVAPPSGSPTQREKSDADGHQISASKTNTRSGFHQSPHRGYSKFDQIDGSHPWKAAIPGSYKKYPTRRLVNSRVSYFNFSLAKEIGLIPAQHSDKLNEALEKKILDTFSLRIINEFDQLCGRRYNPNFVKSEEYMASRYLQLQHADKAGRTSGDGRGIWNGTIQHNGITWDIISLGTGVTAMAPGSVEAGKDLQTGSDEVSYGCGLVEIDELFASAVNSEIFYHNGIDTERMLAIIEFGENLGIGVRAGPNLMRPAHLFRPLKLNDFSMLDASIDYLIDRQNKNGAWKFSSQHRLKYQLLLEEVCESFARFGARLDIDYIFCWLDWDGDNVLADAGFIDYGSVRQFGLRHDQYRYEDVDRFSTTLGEQKRKCRHIVQTFVQAVDFLAYWNKKAARNISEMSACP